MRRGRSNDLKIDMFSQETTFLTNILSTLNEDWLTNESKLVFFVHVLYHIILNDSFTLNNIYFDVFIWMQKKELPTLSTALSAAVNQLALRSELPALPVASDSKVGNYSRNFVMDPSKVELFQKHSHEQRGPIGEN